MCALRAHDCTKLATAPLMDTEAQGRHPLSPGRFTPAAQGSSALWVAPPLCTQLHSAGILWRCVLKSPLGSLCFSLHSAIPDCFRAVRGGQRNGLAIALAAARPHLCHGQVEHRSTITALPRLLYSVASPRVSCWLPEKGAFCFNRGLPFCPLSQCLYSQPDC